MPPVSTEISVAVDKIRGKMLAKEPRLDVLILSNSGCQTNFWCCLWEMKAGLVERCV